MAKTILIVEDDPNISELVQMYLEKEGYHTKIAADGGQGVALFRQVRPDLVLLDIMLPVMDGWSVLRTIRQDSQTPVIMLTARDTVVDKVSGLDSGADDYITKPFALEELLARIRAALRKRPAAPADAPLLTCGSLVMDVERHTVEVDGRGVELTRREFDLLHYLLENKGKVISRESLLDNVWGFDFVGETNAVDVYIRFLRSKIDEQFGVKLIHTVRGVGYVIREE